MIKYNIIKSRLILGLTLFSMAPFALSETIDIQWQDPDNYSDLGTDFNDDVTLEMFSDEMNPYIERLASDVLPKDATLQIVVTDVNLAGEFEPWRINQDVRIVRSIYPPSMEFEYKLFNAQDEVIQSGEEKITDLDFDFNIGRRFQSSDQFFYEKELIAQWVRTELPDIVEMAQM